MTFKKDDRTRCLCMAALFSAVSTLASMPALAQGSVTLYGVIDEGINYTNNVGGHSQVAMASGFPHGSRWGLKGSEDLGGGTQALFLLENGFDVDNGRAYQGGALFGRQAYMGLNDERWGAVTLGRQYDSVVDYLAQTTAGGSWGGYMFAHPYDNDNLINTFRINNAVKYTSPAIGGLKFGGLYGFSEDTKFSNNRVFSGGAQYAKGGLTLAAAYLQADRPSATSFGALNNGADQNLPGSKLRIWGAGGTYEMGRFQLGVSYAQTDVSDPRSSAYVGDIVAASGTLTALRFQNVEANIKYQPSRSYWFGAMYAYTRATFDATSGRRHPVYHSVGLMADYLFSKRTDVYLQTVYQHVAGDKTDSVLDAAYVAGAANVASGPDQVMVRVGVRHFF
ncbi:porin [Cupriavidus plantarum]|uniref:porin n=1 Tax=Cupriavidus plantarum TaxID=942865 RepID=UPI0015CA283B|nr:porin [Cupriavidus plantarum]NYH98915.1 putative porin [Cupriavidus plantarum]